MEQKKMTITAIFLTTPYKKETIQENILLHISSLNLIKSCDGIGAFPIVPITLSSPFLPEVLDLRIQYAPAYRDIFLQNCPGTFLPASPPGHHKPPDLPRYPGDS